MSPGDKLSQPIRRRYPARMYGNKSRSFNPEWYQQYSWLEYSLERDCVYCYPCRHFRSGVGHADQAFTVTGFHDWKHATGIRGAFSKHNRSVTHKHAMANWAQFKIVQASGASVVNQLDAARRQQIKENRYYIQCIVEVLLVCAKQEIALRGHNESADSQNPGNFRAILKLVASHDKSLMQRLESNPGNASYLSPDIQNELLEIMSSIVKSQICQEVNQAGFFTLLCDETKDISKQEQIALVLRYVVEATVYERFVGYIYATELNAESLTHYICDTLASLDIPIEQCICQGYDGATVMSGSCHGVQTRIRELSPKAVYIHCCAHRLNLALVDATKSIPFACEFFTLIEKLYVFLSASKAHSIFLDKQKEVSPDKQTLELKRLVETRWACRYNAIHTILHTYKAILLTLELVSVQDHARGVDAQGIFHQVKSFSFILRLVFFEKLLNTTKGLSEALQTRELDLAAAADLVYATIDSLKEYRTELVWNKVWEDVLSYAAAHDITDEPTSVRHRRPPIRLDDTVITETSGNRSNPLTKDEYRCQYYYPIIDKLVVELDLRFSNLSLSLMKSVQACSPKSSNFLDSSSLQPFIEHYELNDADLVVELAQAKRVLNGKNIVTIAGAIHELLPLKAAFPELLKLLQMALTLCVSTAQCERTFSCLKRIKSNLRSTMGEERLNSLAILSIEKDIPLNLQQVVDEFALKHNNRRICLK